MRRRHCCACAACSLLGSILLEMEIHFDDMTWMMMMMMTSDDGAYCDWTATIDEFDVVVLELMSISG